MPKFRAFSIRAERPTGNRKAGYVNPCHMVQLRMTLSKEQYVKYRQSEEGKAAIRRYEQSDAAKARKRRYLDSDKGRQGNRDRRIQRREANRAITDEAKSAPCADCNQRFDPVCMDFHHVLGKKDFNIGWGRHTPKMLLEEIAKCIVLCSNCHRLRHKR